nr:PREDICTED: uncharacterized protein LOC103314759 isoform X9 [Tribolium castaneum]|eukprot:XP_015837844.1 PREDICTED: uncharacterized protein LOC103314759 isoform X9 [Tribolium castaneum]
MGKICLLCRRIQENVSTRSYHRFPNDHTERVKWFENLEIPPVFTRNIYLCSDHFDPNSFLIRPLGRRVLKKNARPQTMPSICKDTDSESVKTSLSETSSEVSATTIEEVEPIIHYKADHQEHGTSLELEHSDRSECVPSNIEKGNLSSSEALGEKRPTHAKEDPKLQIGHPIISAGHGSLNRIKRRT